MLAVWLVCAAAAAVLAAPKPCLELSPELRHFPCTCDLITPSADETGVSMTCDGASFSGEMSGLPAGAPVWHYKHSGAALRSLPPQVLGAGPPLRSLDLSDNQLRRLWGGQLLALRDTLLELRLQDNLLGDTLNPILATAEFRDLAHLHLLDLSRNGIRAVEAGLVRGCLQLRHLLLDGNLLEAVPAAQLAGPNALARLSLRDNRIEQLEAGALAAPALQHLQELDLSGNGLLRLGGAALSGVPQLHTLRLAHNRLARFDSDAFEGAQALTHLDLADNYLSEFPGVALGRHAVSLTHLDLSANRIRALQHAQLQRLTSLLHLNLSRNEISSLGPAAFLGLRRLNHLDLAVNSLRAIEDDAFEGLQSLETLILTDNNILLVPAAALARLPRLIDLQLDYNRIAAVSGELVGSVAEQAEHLSLTGNVIRELPDGTFRRCRRLRSLHLAANLLGTVPGAAVLSAAADTLQELRLPANRLGGVPPRLPLPQLHTLDLSDNRLTGVGGGWLADMPRLAHLNLSGNARLGLGLSPQPGAAPALRTLDLSRSGLRQLPLAVLASAPGLTALHLADNRITELGERSFVDLRNLTLLDLSRNRITSVRPHAFVNAMSLRQLLLPDNRLVSYGGETFNTGTGLELLDLSANRLAFLSPTAFRIHPRLASLRLRDNRLTYFPAADLVAGLQYLQLLDLSGNALTAVEELDFSRLPRLRTLDLSRNQLDTVADLAFHNSSQLQFLLLGENALSRLSERCLEGLVRLRHLDLGRNQLTELPDTLLDRARLQALDSIDLSENSFGELGAPLRPLASQHFALTRLNLARNNLSWVPADDSVLVNVEHLDLSFNPLSEQALDGVLGEPKTVRVLQLAGTGLRRISARLETPFLTHLNLSHNQVSEVSAEAFERTSLLHTLDLSHNELRSVGAAGRPPPHLQELSLADNPLERVSGGELAALGALRTLRIQRLPLCTRLERDAFAPLARLTELQAHGYPRLGYLDVRGLLRHLPALTRLNIEYMETVYGGGGGGESMTAELHGARLLEVGVHGARVTALAPGALSGLRAPRLTVRFQDTSVTALPPALFFPVPRSTHLTLDVSGSQLSGVPPQLLAALEDRRGRLALHGLHTAPLLCDCSVRPLRQHALANPWPQPLRCAKPQHLAGQQLTDIAEEQLICGRAPPPPPPANTTRRTTVTTLPPPSIPPTYRRPASTPPEPDIIWSVEPRPPARSRGPAAPHLPPQPNNDDTLIIGIVGGVVSFIALLIIGICIVRVRSGGGGGGLPGHAHQHAPGSVCTCSSVKGAVLPPPLYAPFPTHTATLARTPMYQQPYFVPYSPSALATEDKMSHR